MYLKHLIVEVCLCFDGNKDCILGLSFQVLQNKHYVASFEIELGCFTLIVIIVIPSYPILRAIMLIKEYPFRDVPPVQDIRV